MPEGRRYCPAILAANGRVKPNWVLVDGKPEKHESGIYYLEWREDGKRKRLSVGIDSDVAHPRQIRKLAELRALSQGLVVTDVEEEANRNHVRVAVNEFLEEVKADKTGVERRNYRNKTKRRPSSRFTGAIYAFNSLSFLPTAPGPKLI